MGIDCLTPFFRGDTDLWRPRDILDCSLVVDGVRFMLWAHHKSSGDPAYGGDYDLYAQYLKDIFSKFEKINIKCYVLFDGGDRELNLEKKLARLPEERLEPAAFARPRNPVQGGLKKSFPALLRNVLMEVLDEMDIPYATCQFEAADSIIALAKTLKCHILSEDPYFFLCEITYITITDLYYDGNMNSFGCKQFNVHKLLNNYRIEKETLPVVMMVLHDYYFESGYFKRFFTGCKIDQQDPRRRIDALLIWLRNKTCESALAIIFRHIPSSDQNKCKEVVDIYRRSLFGIDTNALAVRMFNVGRPIVQEHDPYWFEKGVLTGKIPKQYIDLYLKRVCYISPQVENFEKDDSLLKSLRILKYAFDLLTNFSKGSFEYHGREGRKLKMFIISSDYSVNRPDYSALKSPFENGWHDLPDFFDHFLQETLPGLPMHMINSLPADCRLFMIALVWLKLHAACDREAYCLLLCYMRLSVLAEGSEKSSPASEEEKPTDVNLDVRSITPEDRIKARKILQRYYPDAGGEEISFDRRFLHPFAQFQSCLLHLNCLNMLCGAPYEPTIYHKVYSGSFIYRVFIRMRDSKGVGKFIQYALRDAGSVRRFYGGLCGVLESSVEGVVLQLHGEW